ncbi:hypothetical protein RRG08_015485 [Elysia crispata]|uniref:Uncharacterized protein n=1 Tax=Elysia crispata TaxID=231223 RepID=A0AAE1A412_9GAST|nr:hypothetical protein RRG08_015485 [Elysia crispata]
MSHTELRQQVIQAVEAFLQRLTRCNQQSLRLGRGSAYKLCHVEPHGACMKVRITCTHCSMSSKCVEALVQKKPTEFAVRWSDRKPPVHKRRLQPV